MKNSIETKENKLLKSNLVKDWKNGMQHTIPVQASFTVLKYLTLTPNFTFTDRMYTDKVYRSWGRGEAGREARHYIRFLQRI